MRKEMNLYFLSLLKKDFKRKKNIFNLYSLETNQYNFVSISMLKNRFPFLEKGDVVVLGRYSFFWTGTELDSNICLEVHHPWFYERIGARETLLSKENRLKLASKLQQKVVKFRKGYEEISLYARLKIGKTKYDVYSFFSSRYTNNLPLTQEDMKKKECVVEPCLCLSEKEDNFVAQKFKKTLFMFFD
jgi:hypothetical protein